MSNKLDKIAWTDVESSNIQAIYFCDRTQTICVRFNSGGLYSYIGLDEEMYMNLLHAPSIGRYLNNVVKAFPYTRWETEAELLAHLNI